MISLTQNQVMDLLEADWLEDGPIRLNDDLAVDDLSGSIVFRHARLIMRHMDMENGIKLTTSGNFCRKFVEQMVEEFDWPGYDAEDVWRYNKKLDQPDFPPLHFLHALLSVAGLSRKYKGILRLSRLGKGLLANERAGELNVVLFEATFHAFNLGYLDRYQPNDDFQPQISLTLYLISQFADRSKTAADLMVVTTLPDDTPRPESFIKPENIFEARVLRYLVWFGLLEKRQAADNDDFAKLYMYRKIPFYDQFLSFAF